MESHTRYLSRNINKFDMTISNAFMDCRIYWARVVSSESESLFAKYQKHSFFEIQYALHKNIDIVLEDHAQLCIKESEFLIVPPDTYHEIVDSDGSGARFIMAFSPTFRDTQVQSAFAFVKELKPYAESAHMRRILSIILEKEFQDDPVCRENITALTECFLLEVIGIALDAELRKPSEQNERTKLEEDVAEMLAYINECNGIGISVADIARQFTVSQRQLIRMFQAVTNAAPSAAIAAAKLKKIEELIATTPLTFMEIAEICGFSDGYAMNKFFKRHNHVNLSEFRRISGKKNREV